MERIRRVRSAARMPAAVAEKIKQRRSQMLIHSYLYYVRDSPVVSDDQWQVWANELTTLQQAHGVTVGFYDAEFADWAGETGCHLPQDEWVTRKALQLTRHIDDLQVKVATPAKVRVRRVRT
jgi:hypothetical protein